MTASPVLSSEVSALFAACDNTGVWGADDQRGTLNYITRSTVLEALALVTAGDVVAFGKPLVASGSYATPGVTLTMIEASDVAADRLTLEPHGFAVTHLDAVGHNSLNGRMYNGRDARAEITDDGLRFGDVAATGAIITRGVLLDIAAAKDLEYVPAGYEICAADLACAETAAGVEAGVGDAIFVRSGRDRRLSGQRPAVEERYEGLGIDAVVWLHERRVAIYSGDCIEARPSAIPELPMPLHQLGEVAMGLAILDNPDIELLSRACAEHQRPIFTLVLSPLPVQGASASAVNPIALF